MEFRPLSNDDSIIVTGTLIPEYYGYVEWQDVPLGPYPNEKAVLRAQRDYYLREARLARAQASSTPENA